MKKKTIVKQRKVRVRKPTKHEMIITATMQDHAHHSTKDISRYRNVVTCQLDTVAEKILDIRKELIQANAEYNRVAAVLKGLELVVEKR